MKNTSGAVSFFYGNWFGRFLLKTIMVLHLDCIAVWFLKSRLSKCMNKGFVKRNNIPVTPEELKSFRSYRELFVRTRDDLTVDPQPDHLVSPCDSWLSVYSLDENSSFAIKNSHYQMKDFLQDEELAKKFLGGTCLIFRLCPTDYHHYCFIDDGYQGENHFIKGQLHSVQPIACETYPVYVKNRRSWCLMDTKHFGSVVQCEVGALVVGGIVNHKANAEFRKGEEKGHFDLAGSTIVLLFEAGKIRLLDEITEALTKNDEVQVKLGQWIGMAEDTQA